MKKAASKRLPLHRETVIQLQGPALAWVQGGSGAQGSHLGTCPNGANSTRPSCPL